MPDKLTPPVPNEPIIFERREVPMEVLVLGMCRTGTLSLKDGLHHLGYNNVYHMSEVFHHGHSAQWKEAAEVHYEGKGEPWTTGQWDRLLGGCMAVTDLPTAMFPASLMRCYPEAKVILTLRSPDSWVSSMRNTVVAYFHNPWVKIHAMLDPYIATHRAFGKKYHKHLWNDDFERNGYRAFEEHNRKVRRLVGEENAERRARGEPERQFLEYEVKQGWGPLCEFLEKDVPERPFPRVNDGPMFQERFNNSKTVVLNMAKEKAMLALPVVTVGAIIWWRYWKR